MTDAEEVKNTSQLAPQTRPTLRGYERQATSMWELLDMDRVIFGIGEMPLITFVALVYFVCRR